MVEIFGFIFICLINLGGLFVSLTVEDKLFKDACYIIGAVLLVTDIQIACVFIYNAPYKIHWGLIAGILMCWFRIFMFIKNK